MQQEVLGALRLLAGTLVVRGTVQHPIPGAAVASEGRVRTLPHRSGARVVQGGRIQADHQRPRLEAGAEAISIQLWVPIPLPGAGQLTLAVRVAPDSSHSRCNKWTPLLLPCNSL